MEKAKIKRLAAVNEEQFYEKFFAWITTYQKDRILVRDKIWSENRKEGLILFYDFTNNKG